MESYSAAYDKKFTRLNLMINQFESREILDEELLRMLTYYKDFIYSVCFLTDVFEMVSHYTQPKLCSDSLYSPW